MKFAWTIAVLFIATLFGSASLADESEKVLAISIGDKVHDFTMSDLKEFGATGFETETIWTQGKQTFTGVSIEALFKELEITTGTIVAFAANDYSVEIPISDAVSGGPILAYLSNGQQMSARDKGPLWIVYPYDSDPKYQSELIYSRSIWQVVRMDILK